MAPVIKKTRTWLDMTEKKQIADFVTANPKDSLPKIAKIFSEKLNKCINKMHIFRIKNDQESIRPWVLKKKCKRGSRKIKK